ncbi:hypothetical protein MIV110R [Invertebrate iridescent virus 3]|uniref:Uncharacterized protein 110R n=1 Tax=Invertebrate iridescent virus 3 TaxID=345201 RepID=110R_IIV3|nr:hypothetical protein MIV110R [Invertebrate iridescent virus 3]Q196V0.1 RecName: Full=Uncharacterized protein 110R [Invertebrate iridescent virus 3]ABF82140.1 hypothetical protein MIV110R [Invertebrate iridescent virus 3]
METIITAISAPIKTLAEWLETTHNVPQAQTMTKWFEILDPNSMSTFQPENLINMVPGPSTPPPEPVSQRAGEGDVLANLVQELMISDEEGDNRPLPTPLVEEDNRPPTPLPEEDDRPLSPLPIRRRQEAQQQPEPSSSSTERPVCLYTFRIGRRCTTRPRQGQYCAAHKRADPMFSENLARSTPLGTEESRPQAKPTPTSQLTDGQQWDENALTAQEANLSSGPKLIRLLGLCKTRQILKPNNTINYDSDLQLFEMD